MSEQDAATMPKTELRHLERVVRLSYLDPSIVRSILDGSQPSHLSAPISGGGTRCRLFGPSSATRYSSAPDER